MKKIKIFITSALLLVAFTGAVISATLPPETLFYYSNNDPATGTRLSISVTVSCPQLGTGCIYEVEEGVFRQLYRQTSPGVYQAIKP